MLRRILLFITLVLAMAFGSYGESHAAPVTKDRLQKVEEHKPQQHRQPHRARSRKRSGAHPQGI